VLWIALPLMLLGTAMLVRGAVYGVAPEGRMAKKRQERNLRAGFTTDMRSFGRRVRRLGALLLLIGLTLVGWQRSIDATDDEPAAAAER
jgi:hypothetical protein